MVLSQREPVRLAHSDSTDEFTLRLLRSAHIDQPPARAIDSAKVHVTALVAEQFNVGLRDSGHRAVMRPRTNEVARQAQRQHAKVDLLRLTRAAGVGLVLGTSLAAAVVGVTRTVPQPAHAPMIAPAPPRSEARPSIRSTARAAAPKAEQDSVTSAPSTVQPSQHRETKAAKLSNNDLGQELSMLDTAKAALFSGNPRLALKALDQASELPRRVLIPEATVLRVRALVDLKRTAEAHQIVERFVAQSPHSPVNPVLHELIGIEKK